ncbi:phage tail assembly chaperone [Alysiella crassa]|uniref:Domain of uncharacterized function (DUF1789) n=1 Tax=Alysiella crassa TaxID=153491 RepID=A0A376BTP7_9NEIS|nr:phage tail assembly chaperone [Alysiella crassa]UOP05872.1 phage tail assembly chaperone [Alysiella crassa]SSY80299.1 Domain of uncharacterised function (DUF1789) [Alysiella crassa]
MTSKLKLNPNPTFELLVSVPVAGKLENEDVLFTVKHLPQTKLAEMFDDGIVYREFGKEMVTGWDIDAPFNQDNLMILFDNYPQSAFLLFKAYEAEYYKAAGKN